VRVIRNKVTPMTGKGKAPAVRRTMGAVTDLLLIHPPAAKPAEPPLGVAVLLAELRSRGIPAAAIDANIDAYLFLLEEGRLAGSAAGEAATALRRSVRNVSRSLAFLRSPEAAASFPRYVSAVRHVDGALAAWKGTDGDERLSLGDYVHGALSPFSPADLERVASGKATTLFRPYFLESLLPRVAARSPGLIGLSVNYRHQVLPAFELAGMLKRAFPAATIVGGGGMFSCWEEAVRENGLRLPAFDRVVFGPGEVTLARLAAGEDPDDDATPAEGGTARFAPDYDSFRLRDYLSPVPVLPVTASRGCYWHRCRFCPEAASPTQSYRSADPASFPGLLRSLSERHGVFHFHLTDNAVPVPVLEALAGSPGTMAGLAWHGFVRFERALREDGLLRGLADAGCRMLQLGLESGSQRVLDRMGKGTRLEDASDILRKLARAGIATYVYVMLGTPGEAEEDGEATLRFLEDHAGAISFLNLAIMNLPRASGFLESPERFGIRAAELFSKDEEPLGLYRTFETETGWGRADARRFRSRRLLASPEIRRIAQRTPPLFTSNHAFLFGPGTAFPGCPGCAR
jgi:hypothetical protein